MRVSSKDEGRTTTLAAELRALLGGSPPGVPIGVPRLAGLPAYVLTPAAATCCPRCEHETHLLVADNDDLMFMLPAFYLCRACGWLGQIGVGPVAVVGEEVAEPLDDSTEPR